MGVESLIVSPNKKSALRIPDIIKSKRNGNELTNDEINFFIKSICDLKANAIQESQIGKLSKIKCLKIFKIVFGKILKGALLMAIFFKGLTFEESFLFTKAMMNSGASFKWPKPKYTVVDKHSTGGVGDKISLPLAPALAACGVKVNK